MLKYLLETPDAKKSPLAPKIRRGFELILTSTYVHRKQAWVIDEGDAIMWFRFAPKTIPPAERMFNHAFQRVYLGALQLLMVPFQSREQKKRLKENDEKAAAAIEQLEQITGDTDEMLYLNLLAVAPEKQGLGYGTALVAIATAEADKQNRSIWLGTLRETAPFYERLGFTVEASFTLGDDNPTWTLPPIVEVFMVRRPQDPMGVRSEKAFV